MTAERYFCIKTIASVHGTEDVYAHGDGMQVNGNGDLFIYTVAPDNPVLIFAAGTWKAAYSAHPLDGSAWAVEHWKGEVHSSAED